LAWFERLIAHAAELMASGAPVVPAGDYNVVPTPQDIYPTRSSDNNALIQPESRQAFASLLAQGWTEAIGWLLIAGEGRAPVCRGCIRNRRERTGQLCSDVVSL
jgi:hypothetical protein